jgi:hypothetical protein
MRSDQAEKIVTRIFARFPRAHLSDAVMSAWAGSLEDFEFDFATQWLKPVITTAQGDYPPPLNALRKVLVDRQEQEEKASQPPEPRPVETVEEGLGRSVRTPTHRKYLGMITYLRTHAETLPRPRGAPIQLGGRRRIEDRLRERYGSDWEYEENWEMEGGSAYPLHGEEGRRYAELKKKK